MSAYLMVYFKDDTHSIHFAISNDGYTFTDVNSGNPVIKGDTIALQKGVRDPYITRGEDGIFYLVMTDLHIFGLERGIRNSQWDRSEKDFGWGNNTSIILMKSKDLKHWTHTILDVSLSFPSMRNIGCAWAPELIYDDNKKRYMVYLTMRFGSGLNKIYYAYLNKSFDALETEPKLLFQYPKTHTSYIDADIIKVKDKFHMFYVPHDGVAGIKQAISRKINKGYRYFGNWTDPEAKACEAPSVWKRIGEDKWVLMYDIYGINPHNFGFSETTDFITFKDLGHFNEGVMKTTNFTSPKHGSVIHLTAKEADELSAFWKSSRKSHTQ
ncbi:glycoside hydrolase family 43 protein [Pedobacter agri]|uniref:glycoside hydrolase family 43 protein n=1 Tax=Pedobacter agri TaxID=454586 RepID=UPI0029301E43|nr:glycoside hydrolase family 43 protein [Pedobacter agri]